MCMFCRSFFVLLVIVLSVLCSFGHCVVCSSFFWSLCCLFFVLLVIVLSVLCSFGHCVVCSLFFWSLCCLFFVLLVIVLSVLCSFGHCVVCSLFFWSLCCLFFVLLVIVLSVLRFTDSDFQTLLKMSYLMDGQTTNTNGWQHFEWVFVSGELNKNNKIENIRYVCCVY